jgi:hypothetical protein
MHIVTGFISQINDRADRNLSKYIELGKQLLSVEIDTTCFIERSVFNTWILPVLTSTVSECVNRGEFSYVVCGHVHFVFFEKSDLFLWPYRDVATQFKVNTGNPTKDTIEYMMVQCQKTEWIRMSIELHREIGTSHSEFTWIDFGSFHMFGGSVDTYQMALHSLMNRIDNRVRMEGKSNVVRIAGCWEPTRLYAQDIYRDICWIFAGSVFGGGDQCMERFAAKMRETCIRILTEKHTLMWEVNVWVLIYREIPELFSWYKSDHSPILFDGYC